MGNAGGRAVVLVFGAAWAAGACKAMPSLLERDAGRAAASTAVASAVSSARPPPSSRPAAEDAHAPASTTADAETASAPYASLTFSTTGQGEVVFPEPAGRELPRLQPKFKACYQHGLLTDRTQRGAPVITLNVAPEGEVKSVDIRNDGLGEDVVGCLRRALQSAQLDPALGDGRTIRFQVTFVPPK